MTRNYDAPSGLRDHDSFVVWRMEKAKDSGKPTKIPYRPANPDVRASSANLDHCSDLATAVEACRQHRDLQGLGFVFHPINGVVGVDLDHCVDQSTLEIEGWAMDIVRKLDSYTEFSPSQTGLHIFVYANAWQGAGTNQVNVIPGSKIEMYCKDRFFTLTGDHVPGTPTTVEDRPTEFSELHSRLM